MFAEHALSGVKGEMVIEPAHYASLPLKSRPAILKPAPMISELTPGPGAGLHYAVPEVEFRSLAIYEEVPMSLQSERRLNHMLRLRLSYLPNCYEALAEEAASKDLLYLDFL